MNKGITLLVLGVLLCAMAIIFYMNVSNPAETKPAPVTLPPLAVQVGNATGMVRENTPQNPTTAPAIRPVANKPQGGASTPSTLPPVPAVAPVTLPAEALSTPVKNTQHVVQQAPQVTTTKPVAAPAPMAQPKPNPTPPIAAQPAPKPEPQKPQPVAAAKPQPKPEPVKAQQKPEPTKPQPAEPAVQAEKPELPFTLDETSLSATGKHALQSIELEGNQQEVVLRVTAHDPFPCKVFVLKEPDRLVVDFPGTWQNMRTPQVPAGLFIKGARLGNHPTGPRLVLDLARPAKAKRIRPDAQTVELVIE